MITLAILGLANIGAAYWCEAKGKSVAKVFWYAFWGTLCTYLSFCFYIGELP